MKTYLIYCDESVSHGEFFSNFYGGALVEESQRDYIETMLAKKKASLNLMGEIKWSKTTGQYLEKYISFIEEYFTLIRSGHIKIRIMFRQNINQADRLTQDQQNNEYTLLYYQFFKHAFGLKYCGSSPANPVRIIPLFDQMPDTKQNISVFKDYIARIPLLSGFDNIIINRDEIAEIDSHKHVILQGMDVILVSMQFRLNKEHLRKDPDTGRRGKRTIAKERLYKYILSEINKIHPNFNIGVSTGFRGSRNSAWNHPYSHWSFKPKQKKDPTSPT